MNEIRDRSERAGVRGEIGYGTWRGYIDSLRVNVVSVRIQDPGNGLEILRVHIGQHDSASRAEAVRDRYTHSTGPDDDDDVVTHQRLSWPSEPMRKKPLVQ